MRNRIIILLTTVLFALSLAPAAAQDNPSRRKPSDIDQLKKMIEEQDRRVKQLQEQIERQNGILLEQQKQINELLKIREQKEATADKTQNQSVAKSAPANQTAEVKPAAQATPKPDRNVESGFGKVRFTGMIQAWYSAGNGSINTFRFRRAEMKFTGQISPKVRWTLMIDPAKALSVNTSTSTINGVPVVTSVSPNQSSRILQDAFITLSYLKNVNVDIGQFKIPLSQEGLQSSGALDTVERALFMSDRGRGGGLGDIRDFGVQFSGPLGKDFNYQIGVFNGTGESQNSPDSNQEKAVIGRFIVRPPFVKGLQLGVSGAWSNYNRLTNPRRDRFGGELLYADKKVRVKTEVMGAVDGDLHRLGFYSHFGYRIVPKFEAVFRIDGFDPDRRRESNSANVFELDYIGGFNYCITENNFKFQFNYIRKTFNNRIVSPRNLFLANLQTSW